MKQKGISVEVFKTADPMMGDCTNGGASSKYTGFVLTGRNVAPVTEPTERKPELVLTPGPMNTLRAVPRDLFDAGKWVMFGGNFVYTSDSRFGELNNGAPIKIFDRVESK